MDAVETAGGVLFGVYEVPLAGGGAGVAGGAGAPVHAPAGTAVDVSGQSKRTHLHDVSAAVCSPVNGPLRVCVCVQWTTCC